MYPFGVKALMIALRAEDLRSIRIENTNSLGNLRAKFFGEIKKI